MAASRTAHWWSPLTPERAADRVRDTLAQEGMTTQSSAGHLTATAPASLLRNRWRATFDIRLQPDDEGTAITCTVKTTPGQRNTSLARLRKALADVVYDHELSQAVAPLRGREKLSLGPLLDVLRSRLDPREPVLALAAGTCQGHAGLLALTRERVLFVTIGAVSDTRLEYPLTAVTAVSTDSTPLTDTLQIRTSSASGTITGMPRGRSDEFSRALRAQQRQDQSATAGPLAGPADRIERLERLAVLHHQGSLDDEEFARLKSELLAGA